MRSVLRLGAMLFLTISSCVIDANEPVIECGEHCDETSEELPHWANALKAHVSIEIDRLTNEQASGPVLVSDHQSSLPSSLCVSRWAAGGAMLGEVASKACIAVGVSTSPTGAGLIVAGVCKGSDIFQVDAMIGSAIGFLSGIAMCNAGTVFEKVSDNLKVFNVDAEEEASDVPDWSTPECQATYEEYKDIQSRQSSCKSLELSCTERIDNFFLNRCEAQLRQEHMYDCPHNEGYNWDSHHKEVSKSYVNADWCHRKLCQSDCLDFLSGDDIVAYEAICYFSDELFTRAVCDAVL